MEQYNRAKLELENYRKEKEEEAKRKGLEHSTFADWFCFIEKYVGFAIDKNRNFDGANYQIEPLDINSMSAAFPTGILADGSDLAATLTVNFGMVTNLINSAKVACIDVADEYPQITGYELTPGVATATTVSFIATDCAGAEASDLVAIEVYVNGKTSTAVASALVGGHKVYTATFAAAVIVEGVNTLVLDSTSKYGKTTFKYTA